MANAAGLNRRRETAARQTLAPSNPSPTLPGSAVSALEGPEEIGVRAEILRRTLAMLRQPIAADKRAGALAAIRPGSDIGLTAVNIDSVEKVDANDRHHVVHQDFAVKTSEVGPGIKP
jgi:hypothetical protein